jgi:hypothetical protein
MRPPGSLDLFAELFGDLNDALAAVPARCARGRDRPMTWPSTAMTTSRNIRPVRLSCIQRRNIDWGPSFTFRA